MTDSRLKGRQVLLSVGVVAYQSAEFLPELIDSILNQVDIDFDDLEIVIADDASTDATDEVIARYEGSKPPIIYVKGERRLGVTGNSNRALLNCTGRYIAMSAGDDVMAATRLRDQLNWFQSHPAGVLCGSGVEVFEHESGRVLSTIIDTELLDGSSRAKIVSAENQLATSRFMFDRSKAPDVIFDERLPTVSDWLFFNELLMRGEFGSTGRVGIRYRRHPNNLTAPGAERMYLDDRLLAIELLIADHPELAVIRRRQRSNVFVFAGKRMYLAGDARAARKFARRAIREYPRNPRSYEVLGAASLGAPGRAAVAAVRKRRNSG